MSIISSDIISRHKKTKIYAKKSLQPLVCNCLGTLWAYLYPMYKIIRKNKEYDFLGNLKPTLTPNIYMYLKQSSDNFNVHCPIPVDTYKVHI